MTKRAANSDTASEAQLVCPRDLDARLPGICVGERVVVGGTVDGV